MKFTGVKIDGIVHFVSEKEIKKHGGELEAVKAKLEKAAKAKQPTEKKD